ncbi:MAG: hypothetical protein LBK01_03260, partial [Burkholderiaceae bacterium]|nr:hypothetical protein [Burkholderiaceae bacterium]
MSALDFLMDRESNWPGTIRAHDFLGTVEPGIGLSRPPHAVSAAEIVDISENPTPDLYEPRANGEPLGAGQTLRTLGNSLMSSVTHGLPGAWAGMVEGQDYGKTTDWTNNASLATDFQQPGM